MLLYDRVLDWAEEHSTSDADSQVLEAFREAHVFQLTDIIPLCQDWESQREMPIPKRPPYDNLWAEWIFDESEHTRWHVGSWCLLFPGVPYFQEGAIGADFYECDFFYWVKRFQYCLKNDGGEGPSIVRVLAYQAGDVFFGLRDHCQTVRIATAMLDPAKWQTVVNKEQFTAEHTIFQLPLCVSFYEDRYNMLLAPWPIFMASALLHCRNISALTVQPQAKLSKKHQKKGKRPRATYKTLRIDIPITNSQHAMPETSVHTGVRLHLCRGHFKHLQHKRFKAPGWYWWPAHFRGDPALGIVTKDYALHQGV